jgi:hypothetical protein
MLEVVVVLLILLILVLCLKKKRENVRVGSPFDFRPGTFRIGSFDPNDYASEIVK